jgi:hypothetical protein
MEIEQIKIVKQILTEPGFETTVLILEPWTTYGWKMSISMMRVAEESWPVGNLVAYLFQIPLFTKIKQTGVTRFFFQGCSVYDHSGYGFWLRSPASDSPNNTIIGCVFENNTLGCIKEDPGALVYQAANICW